MPCQGAAPCLARKGSASYAASAPTIHADVIAPECVSVTAYAALSNRLKTTRKRRLQSRRAGCTANSGRNPDTPIGLTTFFRHPRPRILLGCTAGNGDASIRIEYWGFRHGAIILRHHALCHPFASHTGEHVMTRTKTIRLITLAQDVAPRSALCRKHIVHTTGCRHMTYQPRPLSKGGLPAESR